MKDSKVGRLLLVWSFLFLLALGISLYLGSGDIRWGELFADGPNLSKTLFWQLRLPRALAAAVVGGALALVGAVLQSSLRNPLADPFLLGVSSAAATGAVLALASGFPELRFLLSIAASLLCLFFLDALAFRKGSFSNHNLLLGGVAVTYLLSALTAAIVILADPGKTRGLIFWLMGGFSATEPLASSLTCAGLAAACGYFLLRARDLDLLALGDESAHVLGLRPARFRRALFVACAALVGLTVATAGGIGFVGILVPHIARRFCGVSHRELLPLCLLGGAILTLGSDTLARVAFAPREVPVGLITALLGSPFFLFQLRRGGGW